MITCIHGYGKACMHIHGLRGCYNNNFLIISKGIKNLKVFVYGGIDILYILKVFIN